MRHKRKPLGAGKAAMATTAKEEEEGPEKGRGKQQLLMLVVVQYVVVPLAPGFSISIPFLLAHLSGDGNVMSLKVVSMLYVLVQNNKAVKDLFILTCI